MKLKKKVNFDVCTHCNHSCTFCSNPDSRTVKDMVSAEQFDTVMENITKYLEFDELGLSAKGEVLINKDLPKIAHIAKHKYNVPYIYISSNGSLATKEKMEELITNGLDSTKFSINAFDRESYKKVHGKDDFEKVIQNLKDLIDMKKEKYPEHRVLISAVVDIEEEELNNHIKSLIGEERFNLLFRVMVYKLSYAQTFGDIDSNAPITKKCRTPFDEIYINSNGTLGLCCRDHFDSINFGSLIENDFMDVYHSAYFNEIRAMHETNEFPDNHLCKNCLLYGGV